MRIDTDLRDIDRQAVKAFADANNLTMKGAYSQLIRDALWGRTSLAYFPGTGNMGVKWDGYKKSIRTNIDADKIRRVLEANPDEFHYLYMPKRFALEEEWVEFETEPSIFDVDLEDSRPDVKD